MSIHRSFATFEYHYTTKFFICKGLKYALSKRDIHATLRFRQRNLSKILFILNRSLFERSGKLLYLSRHYDCGLLAE